VPPGWTGVAFATFRSQRYAGREGTHLSAIRTTIGPPLTLTNVFMTFPWHGHLQNLSARPWIFGQLRILQGVITLLVFVPFAVPYLRERPTWDYLWAGLCILGAVYFLFRSKLGI